MLAGSSDAETLKAQEDFARANGISPTDYANAYNSFSVHTNLSRAEEFWRRYEVREVPLFVINGKYTTDVAKAGNENNLFSVINYLTAAEHRH